MICRLITLSPTHSSLTNGLLISFQLEFYARCSIFTYFHLIELVMIFFKTERRIFDCVSRFLFTFCSLVCVYNQMLPKHGLDCDLFDCDD